MRRVSSRHAIGPRPPARTRPTRCRDVCRGVEYEIRRRPFSSFVLVLGHRRREIRRFGNSWSASGPDRRSSKRLVILGVYLRSCTMIRSYNEATSTVFSVLPHLRFQVSGFRCGSHDLFDHSQLSTCRHRNNTDTLCYNSQVVCTARIGGP